MPAGPVRVVFFGPGAEEIAQSPEVVSELRTDAQGGREWEALPVESKQNWGAASSQLAHALMDEHAFAIVALDREASHLSEQMALKSFVPVMALSDDMSLTSANIPWIFRLPSGTSPAAALRLLKRQWDAWGRIRKGCEICWHPERECPDGLSSQPERQRKK